MSEFDTRRSTDDHANATDEVQQAAGKRSRTQGIVQAKASGASAPAEPASVGNDFAQPIPVMITASALRIRTAPNTSSSTNIVGRFRSGDQVPTVGREGAWLRVQHKGRAAFIHGKYTKPAATPDVAQAPQPSEAPDPGKAPTSTPQPAEAPPAAPAPGPGSGLADAMAAIFAFLKSLTHASDEEDGKPDAPVDDPAKQPAAPADQGPAQGPQPAPTPQPEPEPPAPVEQGPTSDNPTPAPAPAPTPPAQVPAGAAALKDKELAVYLAGLNNGSVNAAAHGLAGLEAKSAALAENLDKNEEYGADRDALVADIGVVRGLIAAIDGLDPATQTQAKGRLYRAVGDVAPYYSQGRNMNVLEADSTRTCNVTSLAMVLESLGKSPNDYAGNRKKVLAAANCSTYKSRVSHADRQVKGAGEGDWSKMAGLRMSDFLQLAAIAQCMSGTSESAVLPAAQEAWKAILSIGFLKTLAGKFGCSGEIKNFTTDPDKSKKDRDKDINALSGFGSKHRKEMEELVDLRNKAEASGSEKDQQKYEKRKAQLQDALDGKGIESKVSIADYKNAIVSQVGPELDGGAGLVVNITGHYVRLQNIHDDHVVVDDPGRFARANRKVLWEEARAMGYFKRRLILT